MIRLKKNYEGKSALVVMGGPSIIENNYDLSLINKDRYTVFIESKALTPLFLKFRLEPDFFLMFFPEKCQSNSMQMVIYQSFLADINLTNFIKPEYLEEYYYLKNNFEQNFELWNPKKGKHKRFKFKNNVILKNSPWSLLENIPELKIITRNDDKSRKLGPDVRKLKNDMFYYTDQIAEGEFNIDNYFTPSEVNGCVRLNGYGHLNSAAIALFPLLFYMGFRKIYLIGMDMSMLGSMEYSSLYTFRSLKHYKKFFNKAGSVFNYNFKKNKVQFMRPPYEFDNMRQIMTYDKVEFINIYEPFEFAAPFDLIRNISFRDFLNE